jgi:SpoVK/Ycf46/Vps4 family AAA+-type ATPase
LTAPAPPATLPSVNIAHELLTLVRSRYPVVGVETQEEARLEAILTGVAAELGVPLWTWDTAHGLVHRGTGNAMYNTARPEQVLGYLERSAEDGLFLLKDLHHSLGEPAVQRALKSAALSFRQDRRAIFLLAPAFTLPAELEKEVLVVPLALPGPDELRQAVHRSVNGVGGGRSVRIELTPREMEQLVAALSGLTLEEAERAVVQVVIEDRALLPDDITRILELKQKTLLRTTSLEYIAADVDLDQVAGLANLKRWLARRRGAFGSEAREFGLEPPRGILLLGVQGCGKSLVAKAVAGGWRLPLLRLDPGTLYDKFVGESERRLRDALRSAEAMAPAVLWVDEIEKGFPGVGSSDADGGLTRRLFGTFLAWLQERRRPVFVVATANDIAALPPELIRKGRFDEIFFVDLPGPEARVQILRIHLKRRGRDPQDFDLAALAAATEGFSGAEIEQAVVGALYTAFSEAGRLDTDLLRREIAGTRPLSVTMAERVAALREWARERTVPAD